MFQRACAHPAVERFSCAAQIATVGLAGAPIHPLRTVADLRAEVTCAQLLAVVPVTQLDGAGVDYDSVTIVCHLKIMAPGVALDGKQGRWINELAGRALFNPDAVGVDDSEPRLSQTDRVGLAGDCFFGCRHAGFFHQINFFAFLVEPTVVVRSRTATPKRSNVSGPLQV